MTATDETPSRLGSLQDLARRMDRMEDNQTGFTRELTNLSVSVSLIAQNQQHTGKAVDDLADDLKSFMRRIDGMISGEIDTAQARQGRELVDDYRAWRKEVDDALAVLTNQNVRQGGVNEGIGQTFGRGKAVLVTLASVGVFICTFLGALHTFHII